MNSILDNQLEHPLVDDLLEGFKFVPEVTEPLDIHHLSQPHWSDVYLSDRYAYMEEKHFDRLISFESPYPREVYGTPYVGKMWKNREQGE